MIYLILAIASSSLISIFMRLSENHIKNEMGMFMASYALCAALAVGFMDKSAPQLLLGTHDQHLTVILGIITGAFFLGGFLFLKYNMKYNGIVLSSTFMKLGVLIPTIMAIVVFGEVPSVLQIVGIAIAIVAIIIINFEKEPHGSNSIGESKNGNKKILLLVLLLLGGLGDSMSNIFEKLGPDSGKDGFLLLTFFTAFVITIAIVILGKKKLCKADILFGLLVGVPNYFSARFLLASLGSLEAVIVYPTYSVGTMVVVTIVGVIAFREKISKQKGLALGLIAVAIALLNM
mgnify:CR=1 FL=1